MQYLAKSKDTVLEIKKNFFCDTWYKPVTCLVTSNEREGAGVFRNKLPVYNVRVIDIEPIC
jgi:hypothetical protein